MKKRTIHPLRIDFEIPLSPEIKLSRFVNLFILEGEAIHLIDTGVAAAFPTIQHFLEIRGRNIMEIKTILLTHSHPDHIGAARILKEKTGCRVIAPKNEMNWIEDTGLQNRQRPVPGFLQLVAGPVKVDQTVSGFQNIRLEPELTIQIVPTPGHSSGSTSWFLPEEKALFSGDAVLLPGELPVFENISDFLYSLETIKNLQPEILYSAWDSPRTGSEINGILEKSKNYILHIQKTVGQVAPGFKGDFSMDFCKAVLKKLGKNESVANPLLLKSFLACL